jgi:hypothetical protein
MGGVGEQDKIHLRSFSFQLAISRTFTIQALPYVVWLRARCVSVQDVLAWGCQRRVEDAWNRDEDNVLGSVHSRCPIVHHDVVNL